MIHFKCLKTYVSPCNTGDICKIWKTDCQLFATHYFTNSRFDKLRREWQMHRGFVTATQLLKPDVTFFLGDLFDEGKWASEQDFTGKVREHT